MLMASAEGIGQADTDALMKAMGGKGEVRHRVLWRDRWRS